MKCSLPLFQDDHVRSRRRNPDPRVAGHGGRRGPWTFVAVVHVEQPKRDLSALLDPLDLPTTLHPVKTGSDARVHRAPPCFGIDLARLSDDRRKLGNGERASSLSDRKQDRDLIGAGERCPAPPAPCRRGAAGPARPGTQTRTAPARRASADGPEGRGARRSPRPATTARRLLVQSPKARWPEQASEVLSATM